MTVVALALLAGSSWTLGTAALSRLAWPDLRPYERAALRLTAGLGLTALLVSLMTLSGWFSHATAVLAALTAVGAGVYVGRVLLDPASPVTATSDTRRDPAVGPR